MDCNLTDKERKNGMRCRSFDCVPCREFGLSANDASIINIHLRNIKLKTQLEEKQKELDRAIALLRIGVDKETRFSYFVYKSKEFLKKYEEKNKKILINGETLGICYKSDLDKSRTLLIESLGWLEHDYDLPELFSPFCINEEGDCFRCSIEEFLKEYE